MVTGAKLMIDTRHREPATYLARACYRLPPSVTRRCIEKSVFTAVCRVEIGHPKGAVLSMICGN